MILKPRRAKRYECIHYYAFCSYCNERVEVKWEDCGIGRYEFWGSVETDVRWEAVCSECGSGLLGTIDEEVEYVGD
jgi:hypothetical protein